MTFLKNALELNQRMQGWNELDQRLFYRIYDGNKVSGPLFYQIHNGLSFA